MKASLSFIDNLSIHGIRHVFNGNKFKRIFWSFAIFGSAAFLCFNIFQLHSKLEKTPDINVRVGQKFITNIPFPSITICTPLFATNRLVYYYNISKHIRQQLKIRLNLTVHEQNYLASNIHACLPEFASFLQPHVKDRTRNDIVNLLDESFLSTRDTILNCGYKNFTQACARMFYRVLTDRGFCFSSNLQGFSTIFNENIISPDFKSYKKFKIKKSINDTSDDKIEYENETTQWTLDKGYISNQKTDLLPMKITKGSSFGCNPFMNDSDPTNICTSLGNSFSYYIHLPNEIMLPFHQEHIVEFKKRKDVYLTAISYTADAGMRKFSPRSRGCYFEGEKQLKFFKTYTKALCEFECMTNYTLKKCGCVKFSMPRTSETKVCTIENSDCYFEAMSIWPDHETLPDRFEVTCGCLKTCNNIKYEVKFEKLSTSENVMTVFEILKLSKDAPISRVNFMFDDFEIIEYEEYASYKLHNFVADVGGVLGFFLGCSILSLIELIYFLFETCAASLRNRLKTRSSKTVGKNKTFLKPQPVNLGNVENIQLVQTKDMHAKNNPMQMYDKEAIRNYERFYY